MNAALIAFTARGETLARALAVKLGGKASRCGRPESLPAWTARCFAAHDALIFVGAAGIAVRAIAPHIESKAEDPAVIVMDERGQYVIPILSGHLGGANDLARHIAAWTGGVPVLTTATDVNGAFAVDEWARRQGCAVANPERIKAVSAKVLAGGNVILHTDFPIAGTPPACVRVLSDESAPCDFTLTVRRTQESALHIVPRIAVLGVGCRRNAPREAVEAAFSSFLSENDLAGQSIRAVCSIDRKADEPGLLAFCAAHGLSFQTFSADALRKARGEFAASPFVESVVGVDNVCERAAVLGSGGTLYCKKKARDGVTMALALAPFAPDWRWTE